MTHEYCSTDLDDDALLPHHREHLLKGGLVDKTIEETAIVSIVDREQAAWVLNWQGSEGPAPAIAFPNFGINGEIIIYKEDRPLLFLRPDHPRVGESGKQIKYETPVGASPKLYFPPPPIVASSAWLEVRQPLLLVEGIKKSLVAAQAGVPAISSQGTYVWHDIKNKRTGWRLHPDFDGVPLKGRGVFIGFDGGDTTVNPPVIDAEARLARMLLDAGAVVHLLRIPSPNDAAKVGLDDFLVQQPDREAALRVLMDEARPADPLERAHATASGRRR